MVQDSLVEYISSQMKAGVGRDAIKASLVGAGWQATDVEDTLKKVEGNKPAQPAATPVAAASPAAKPVSMGASSPASSPAAKPATSAFPATGMSSKANEPQMIRVSDLISASPASSSSASSPASSGPSKPISMSTPASSSIAKPAAMGGAVSSSGPSMASKVFSKPTATTSIASTSSGSAMGASVSSSSSMAATGSSLKTRNGLVWMIVGGVVIVALLGLSGFLYFQNSSLTSKVASLNTMSTSVSSQIASLNQQVSALDASNTALSATGDSLTQQNSELSLELSFYAMPPGGSTQAIGPVNLSGALSGGGKTPYVITTSYGAKIFVQNSKDAAVIAAFATSTGSPVQVSGTYVQGSQNISITAVNGAPIAK